MDYSIFWLTVGALGCYGGVVLWWIDRRMKSHSARLATVGFLLIGLAPIAFGLATINAVQHDSDRRTTSGESVNHRGENLMSSKN